MFQTADSINSIIARVEISKCSGRVYPDSPYIAIHSSFLIRDSETSHRIPGATHDYYAPDTGEKY